MAGAAHTDTRSYSIHPTKMVANVKTAAGEPAFNVGVCHVAINQVDRGPADKDEELPDKFRVFMQSR